MKAPRPESQRAMQRRLARREVRRNPELVAKHNAVFKTDKPVKYCPRCKEYRTLETVDQNAYQCETCKLYIVVDRNGHANYFLKRRGVDDVKEGGK